MRGYRGTPPKIVIPGRVCKTSVSRSANVKNLGQKRGKPRENGRRGEKLVFHETGEVFHACDMAYDVRLAIILHTISPYGPL